MQQFLEQGKNSCDKRIWFEAVHSLLENGAKIYKQNKFYVQFSRILQKERTFKLFGTMKLIDCKHAFCNGFEIVREKCRILL